MTTTPSGNASAAIRRVAKQVVRGACTVTAPLRPPPDLVIAGVKRGGTTSLFRDLERHPAMLPLVPSARWLPLRSNQKGVHYFDDHFARSAYWYRGHFATTVSRGRRTRVVGAAFAAEASPYTVFHPLAPSRAAALLPDTTQFVLLLRDPVERTISHWAEQTRNGVEQLPLEQALDAEAERVGNDEALLAAGRLSHSFAHEQQSYAAQSRYARSLERWFDTVGRSRTMVMFSEDYYADPASVIGRVTDALGVAPLDEADTVHANAAPRPGQISPELEARLVDAFADDVAAVAQLLGTSPPWPRFSGR